MKNDFTQVKYGLSKNGFTLTVKVQLMNSEPDLDAALVILLRHLRKDAKLMRKLEQSYEEEEV